MNYYSTRDRERAHGCSLREAAMMGLAPDGGLFVPERIPQADMALAERLASESYAALAGYLAGLFFGGDFDSQAVQRELDGLYDFPVPLRVVGRGRYTLELFPRSDLRLQGFRRRVHGPDDRPAGRRR